MNNKGFIAIDTYFSSIYAFSFSIALSNSFAINNKIRAITARVPRRVAWDRVAVVVTVVVVVVVTVVSKFSLPDFLMDIEYIIFSLKLWVSTGFFIDIYSDIRLKIF